MSNLISPTDSLTIKQTKALEFLILGNTIQESADLAFCSENSIDKWLKQKPFIDALNFAKKTSFDCASRRLSQAFIKSVIVLEELMLDSEGTVATSHRIKCADLLLQNALRVAELNEMNDRISSLEYEVTLYDQ